MRATDGSGRHQRSGRCRAGRSQAKIHELVINAVVYAELSVSFSTIELLNGTIATMQLTLRDIPFIGAHAAVENWPLLTRDGERFRTCFAGLHVIAP